MTDDEDAEVRATMEGTTDWKLMSAIFVPPLGFVLGLLLLRDDPARGAKVMALAAVVLVVAFLLLN